MYQTTLPASWLQDAESSSEKDYAEDEQQRRGRKPQPLQWTRVKSLDQIRQQKVLVFEAEKDLNFDKNLKAIRNELN